MPHVTETWNTYLRCTLNSKIFTTTHVKVIKSVLDLMAQIIFPSFLHLGIKTNYNLRGSGLNVV